MARSAVSQSKPIRSAAAGARDARVDAKIARASAALQPVLNHIRELVHEAVPGVTETIKWGMPFFELDGVILAHLGVFKNHCSLGYWSRSMKEYLAANGVQAEEGAGSFGRIATVDDLPSYKELTTYTCEAAAQIRNGQWQSPFAARPGRVAKPAPTVPADFAAALQAAAGAGKHFEAFSPSCRREYLNWIASAKREETRARRIASAVANIAEGKPQNWQYAKPQAVKKASPEKSDG